MRHALSLACLLAPAALLGDPALTKKDHEALQGTWTVVSLERSGRPAVKPKSPDENTVEVKGNKLTLVSKRPGGKDRRDEVTFALDPSKSPRQITLTVEEGATRPGIYKLEGARLVICFDRSEKDGVRPDKFEAVEGKDHVLMVLERLKR